MDNSLLAVRIINHKYIVVERSVFRMNDVKKKVEQKIICLNQGSGTAYERLDELLSSGWVIKQIASGSSADGACCFVWLEREE